MSDKFRIEAKVRAIPVESVELSDGSFKRVLHSDIDKAFGLSDDGYIYTDSHRVKSGTVTFENANVGTLYKLTDAPFSLANIAMHTIYLGFQLSGGSAVVQIQQDMGGGVLQGIGTGTPDAYPTAATAPSLLISNPGYDWAVNDSFWIGRTANGTVYVGDGLAYGVVTCINSGTDGVGYTKILSPPSGSGYDIQDDVTCYKKNQGCNGYSLTVDIIRTNVEEAVGGGFTTTETEVLGGTQPLSGFCYRSVQSETASLTNTFGIKLTALTAGESLTVDYLIGGNFTS